MVIILISLIPLVSFLSNVFNLGLDGISHVARLAVFYQSLTEGNFVPRWAGGSINFGYGHPLFIFNYVTPYYLGSILHGVGLSYEYSIKAVFALTFALSGIVCYAWLRHHIGARSALVGALFFLFAPYRFITILDRSALGEHISFLALPLVCLGFAKLADQKNGRYLLFGSIALFFLILSHFGITLIFLPFLLFYIWYLSWNDRRTLIPLFALVFALGFSLASYLVVPALIEGKYTHHAYYLSLKPYTEFFLSLPALLSLAGKDTTALLGKTESAIRLGPLHLFMFMGSFFLLPIYRTHRSFWLLAGTQATFFISLVMTTEWVRWVWERLPILQIILFPYRFLTITILAGSLLAGLTARVLFAHTVSGWIAAFVGLMILYSNPFWQPSQYWENQGQGLARPDLYYEQRYPFTTGDWLSSPIWSVQFMEQYPEAAVEVIAGKATVLNYHRQQEQHAFEVLASERSRLKENTLYFPGWRIWVDGVEPLLEFQDINHRGVMTFWVEPGRHTVVAQFTETKVRLFGDMVSITTALGMVGGSILWIRRGTLLGCHF